MRIKNRLICLVMTALIIMAAMPLQAQAAGFPPTRDTNTDGTNIFAIEGGTIRVKEADCRGQDCVHFAPINKAGQTIVCLPHHLSVTIEGSSDGPDVVVR